MDKTLEFYIDRYLSGTISTTEWQELQELMKNPATQHRLNQLMDSQLAARAAANPSYPEVVNRLKTAIANEINSTDDSGYDTGRLASITGSPQRRVFLHSPWLRYAAAILVVMILSVTYYFLFDNGKQAAIQQTTIAQQGEITDIAPGGEKALLTLSDGTTIVLDSASSGMLASQGNTRVIKLVNGSIVYHAETTAKPAEILTNTMSTPRGGKYHLVLPDGTGVWLNAASSITYPTVFTGDTRQVSMKGEVYFEVVKNPQIPFVVTLDHSTRIEVTGTSFNVNAYSDEPQCKTTLLEGIVKVHVAGSVKQLRPGQQAQTVLSGIQDAVMVTDNVNLEQVMAWKNGAFSFKNAGIHEVMRQVSRWYDLDIEYRGFTSKAGEGPRFSGDIGMDLNLSAILRVLEKSQVRFRLEGKKLIVTP
ncbi:MAG: FecR domain-containing protein [Chitinophagaceae bacterium]|nr:FecR domain-containing protein [Chitinophagaceae bacterium]